MDLASLNPGGALRRSIVANIETVGGRHDEPAIYGGEPGDPGLAGGPGSMSWEIHGDLASILVAGLGAVTMEVLHPSVMAGVDTGTYRTQPERRARNTLGYVLRTTFGTTAAATKVIEQVRKVHRRIEGVRPDGVPFRALDPDLIAWVHTCIPWAIMTAFERTNRPLSVAEKDRYLTEQAVIGRMGGADRVPETVAELDAFVERMRPLMTVNEQTREFVDFLIGDTGGPDEASFLQRVDRKQSLDVSMSLMPEWARRLTGTHHSPLEQRLRFGPLLRLQARSIRWAYPTLPCHTMALARCSAADAVERPVEPALAVCSPAER